MFRRQRALLEELFHQGVVALGHHFHQRLVGGLRGVGQVRRNIALLALAVAIRRVGVGFHADQVDHALEVALGADGDLDRHGGAAEGFLDACQGALEVERSRSSLLMTTARGSL